MAAVKNGKFLSVETKVLDRELKNIARKYKRTLQKPFKKVAEDLLKDVKRRGVSVPFKKGNGKQITDNIRMKALNYKVGYQVYLMAYVAGWQNAGTKQRESGGGRMNRKGIFNRIKKTLQRAAGGLKNRGRIKGRHYLMAAFNARKHVIVATICKTKIDFEALKQ